MISIRINRKIIFRMFTSFMIAGMILNPLNVSAVTTYDPEFFSKNDINLYNPTDNGTCSAGAFDTSKINNNDYSGAPIFNSAEQTAISQNQSFYASSAQKYNIPWQLIAAIHYRETRFKRDGPANGNGPYQIVGTQQPTGTYTDAQFQTATDSAAAFIQHKVGGSLDPTNQDNIKKALFAYNGTGKVYVTQATALGFSDTQAANGEGSPYVMNRADTKRDPTVAPTKTNNTWGQIKVDGGGIVYPANSDYGAYVIYAALAGISSSTGSSSGACATLSGGGMNLAQAQAFMDIYLQIDHNDPNGDIKYVKPAVTCHTKTDNCVAFSAYFIQKYTTLKFVSNDGGKLVGSIVAANPQLQTGTIPKPYAIFSVREGKTICSDGLPCGHTGIILGVDTANNQIIVGEAAWCNPSFTKAKVYSLSAWSSGAYKYAYMDSYLQPSRQGDLK